METHPEHKWHPWSLETREAWVETVVGRHPHSDWQKLSAGRGRLSSSPLFSDVSAHVSLFALLQGPNWTLLLDEKQVEAVRKELDSMNLSGSVS